MFRRRRIQAFAYAGVAYPARRTALLYAFDPRRVALLLIGGDKTGDDRWYEKFVPLADAIYDRGLKESGQED